MKLRERSFPKKRGRPVGAKNKPKALEKEIAHWEAEPRTPTVNWEELVQKLQNALAKSYVDVDELKKKVEKANMWLNIKQERINQLEDLLAQAVLAGDINFEDEE
jgi:hypothetical protein